MKENNQTDIALSIESLLGSTGDIAYVWDLRNDKIDWFGNIGNIFCNIPATGDEFHSLIYQDDLVVRLQLLSTHFNEGGVFDCEYRVNVNNQKHIWLHDRGRADVVGVGHASVVIGSVRQITARKQRQHHLEYLSNYDELTGHFNKHRFREALDQAVHYSSRYNISGTYLALAIDNLDMINIAYGYNSANTIIVEVSKRIKNWLNSTDIMGRVSGNCYGIIIEQCGAQEIGIVAERLLELVRQQPFETEAGSIYVTVSIGGITFPDQAGQAGEVMSKADSAMAKAKRAGAGTFILYNTGDKQYKQRKQDMLVSASIHRALLTDCLKMSFQPVVNRDKHVCFYEVLVRMITPTGDVVAAGWFVPTVERLGLSHVLDTWVMENVVREASANPTLKLTFNISALTIGDEKWLNRFKEVIAHNPSIANQLIIEITETAIIVDIEKAKEFVRALRDIGCSVAIDDFGAGYTSFLHLSELDVTLVKIDKDFVEDVHKDPYKLSFIRSLLSLTSLKKIEILAEGIEKQEEFDVLLKEDINYFQGYLFGAPELEKPWLK